MAYIPYHEPTLTMIGRARSPIPPHVHAAGRRPYQAETSLLRLARTLAAALWHAPTAEIRYRQQKIAALLIGAVLIMLLHGSGL